MVDVVVESVDSERLALSWCFINADLKPLITNDVTLDDFDDVEHHQIFEWALDHYREYGVSPGVDALKLRNPNWRLATPTDPIDVYIADIKGRVRYNLIKETVQRVGALVDAERDDEAVTELTRGAAELNAVQVTSRDVDITLNTSERYSYYDELRATPGKLRGMATGFHTIDRATGGVQTAQFIMLGGIQKSGKSTALMIIGKNFNLQGKRGLLVSFEMSEQEQTSRWDAIWAQVNYRKLMDGRTTRRDMQKIARAHKKMEDWYAFTLTTDIARMTTVSGIAAKVEKHAPDFLLVDGVYLMMDDYEEPPGSPQALTNITRDLKRLAQRSTVPIIGTTQASEAKMTRARGITSSSFSWSQSFGQDADALIGLQPADEEDERSAEIRVLESRHGPKVRAELIWDWDTMTFEERWDDGNDSAPEGSAGGY